MQENYIKIWTFEDAPEEFRDLSDNGGDEDFIAMVPKQFNNGLLPIFLDRIDVCNDPQIIEFTDYFIYIGSHS